MTNSIRTWAVALAFLAGCSTPTDKLIIPAGDPVLMNVSVTGAVVGSTGKVRAVLQAPVGKEAVVALTSSDPAVAGFPASLTIPPGALGAEGEYTGAAVGGFVLTAKVGTSAACVATGGVVASETLTAVSVSTPISPGMTATGYAAFNLVASGDLTVTLTSSNPSVVTVPASATASAYYSTAYFPVKAVGKGSAIIRATYDGQVRTATVSVVDAVGSVGIGMYPSSRVLKTQTSWLRITVPGAVAADTTIQLTSSPVTVATVPASVVIAAGSSSTEVPITVVSSGAVLFTASGPGQVAATATMTFLDTLAVSGISCPTLPIGTGYCTVGLNLAAPSDTGVALSVPDHPDVLLAPAVVTVPAGNSSLIFPVTGLKAGSASLLAQLNNAAAMASANVGITSNFSFYLSSPSGVTGNEIAISVSLSSSATADTQLSVTSDNPAVFSPAATVLVPGGTYGATIAALGKAAGFAVVTVSGGGMTQSTVVTVGSANPQAPYVYVSSYGPFEKGWSGCLSPQAYGSQSQVAGQTVSVVSSPTGIIQAAASTTWPTNQYSFCIPMKAIAAGTTATTVSVLNYSNAFSFTVVDKAAMSTLGLNASIGVTKTGALAIYLNAQVAADTPVTITQSGTGTIAIPTVVVPTGSSYVSVPVNGTAQGAITITASANGTSASYPTTIGP
jgi:hypothetical protein